MGRCGEFITKFCQILWNSINKLYDEGEILGLEAYSLEEYPDVVSVEFPKEIYITYAVCGNSCGNREFIVDGQTQVCEYCMKSMFRTEVRKYILAEDQE